MDSLNGLHCIRAHMKFAKEAWAEAPGSSPTSLSAMFLFMNGKMEGNRIAFVIHFATGVRDDDT